MLRISKVITKYQKKFNIGLDILFHMYDVSTITLSNTYNSKVVYKILYLCLIFLFYKQRK